MSTGGEREEREIRADLDRARHLTWAADEGAAKDLLLALIRRIEDIDRDDLLLQVYTQLGEIYLTRSAFIGAQECLLRINECLAIYNEKRAGDKPDLAAKVTMSPAEVERMVWRYSRAAKFLGAGLHAAHGDHESAEAALTELIAQGHEGGFPDLADEYRYLLTLARIWCATALCDDDMYVQSLPLWQDVIEVIDGPGDGTEQTDYLRVTGGLGYARFCIETGRLAEAEPWLRRTGACAEARQWELATARTQLERGAASWSAKNYMETERLVFGAYPVIAKHERAHDVSRSWLYFGLTRFAVGMLEAADESWGHAERHWRELGKPLHIHRILLQRSWVDMFCGRYAEALERVAQARELLESSPRSSWLQRARLDDHLGTIWRADALADMNFDGAVDPTQSMEEATKRHAQALGVIRAEADTPQYRSAMRKLEKAADLKVPAALAVDSVRYSIDDAEARLRWAKGISAPILAGAFAVAHEWGNDELLSELIEYHSARGAFSAESHEQDAAALTGAVVAPASEVDFDEMAIAAAGPASQGGPSLTRLGPLPPLRMQPGALPILAGYRSLARERYERDVTADETAWSTWP
jgi:hypothetical protein